METMTKVEMVTTKHVVAEVGETRSGGVRIEYSITTKQGEKAELPSTVVLEFFSVDAVQRIEIAPVDLERASRLMEDARYESTGDLRAVCAIHGYVSRHDCPKCKAEKEKAAAPAPTVEAEMHPVTPRSHTTVALDPQGATVPVADYLF